ncbi:MAG: phosphatidate phosphatase APP1 [Saprospiraceae bacterium]|jgi:phosphatidate phosphatase APP1
MLVRRIIQRWLGFGDVIIQSYHIYQIHQTVYVRGRVLREDNVISRPTDGWLRSLWHMLKRLASDELPHVALSIKLGDAVYQMQADHEGFFEHYVDKISQTIERCELRIYPTQLTTRQSSDVLLHIPIYQFSQQASHGIISDIDDTILKTGVVSRFKWRLIINTLFVSPSRRKSFPRTAAVFNRFVSPDNPIFYISNSPWNMHTYLQEYLEYQGFPEGILLLRDIDFLKWKTKELELQNKYQEIIKVLAAHEELTFILIGDAGEVDIDIYEQIARHHPKRISAIYIRSVKSKKRMHRVRKFAGSTSPVPIIIFDNSSEMAAHAESIGLLEAGM